MSKGGVPVHTPLMKHVWAGKENAMNTLKALMLCVLLGVSLTVYGGSRAQLRESFHAPKIYADITWARFQPIHEEQIADMFVLRDGKEWIQVREWCLEYDEPSLKSLPALETIPKSYEGELHRRLSKGRLLARIDREGQKAQMVVLKPAKGMNGLADWAIGDTRKLWLVPMGQDIMAAMEEDLPSSIYRVVPESEALRYKIPTAREAALAMRNEGRTFMVLLPTDISPCKRCKGRGVDPMQNDNREARRAQQTTSWGGGVSNVDNGRKHWLSSESRAFREAKKRIRRQREGTSRSPCPACDGTGKHVDVEFRTLIFRKE